MRFRGGWESNWSQTEVMLNGGAAGPKVLLPFFSPLFSRLLSFNLEARWDEKGGGGGGGGAAPTRCTRTKPHTPDGLRAGRSCWETVCKTCVQTPHACRTALISAFFHINIHPPPTSTTPPAAPRHPDAPPDGTLQRGWYSGMEPTCHLTTLDANCLLPYSLFLQHLSHQTEGNLCSIWSAGHTTIKSPNKL